MDLCINKLSMNINETWMQHNQESDIKQLSVLMQNQPPQNILAETINVHLLSYNGASEFNSIQETCKQHTEADT